MVAPGMRRRCCRKAENTGRAENRSFPPPGTVPRRRRPWPFQPTTLLLSVIDSGVLLRCGRKGPNTAGPRRTVYRGHRLGAMSDAEGQRSSGSRMHRGREVLTVAGLFIRKIRQNAKIAKPCLLTTGPRHCLSDAAMQFYRMMPPEWHAGMDQQLFSQRSLRLG